MTPGHNLFDLVTWRAGKTKRVAHCSLDAELIEAVECTEVIIGIGELISEALYGVQPGIVERRQLALDGTPWERNVTVGELYTDCNSLVTNAQNLRMDPRLPSRRRNEIADIKQCVSHGELLMPVHVQGKWHAADPLTKERTRSGVRQTLEELYTVLEKGVYIPPYS